MYHYAAVTEVKAKKEQVENNKKKPTKTRKAMHAYILLIHINLPYFVLFQIRHCL